MLIGSKKNTSVCVLGILYKVLIGSNHAGSSKARSAQVLRNSLRAMLLSDCELVRQEITCNENALLCFL